MQIFKWWRKQKRTLMLINVSASFPSFSSSLCFPTHYTITCISSSSCFYVISAHNHGVKYIRLILFSTFFCFVFFYYPFRIKHLPIVRQNNDEVSLMTRKVEREH